MDCAMLVALLVPAFWNSERKSFCVAVFTFVSVVPSAWKLGSRV